MKQLISENRCHYFETLGEDLSSNPKHFWSLFKIKSKNCSMPGNVSLGSDSNSTLTASCPNDIVELFNDYFASVSVSNDVKCQLQVPYGRPEHNLSELLLSPDDVLSALLNLDTNKATGPDGIPAKLLKETAH